LSLGSRIADYSRIRTVANAPTPIAAEPAAIEPSTPVIAPPTEAEPRPKLAPELVVVAEAARVSARRSARGRDRTAALRRARLMVVEVALTAQTLTHKLIHAVIAAARMLTHAGGALMHSAVRAVRLFARLLLRAARALALALPRGRATLTRPLRLALHVGQLFTRVGLRAAHNLAVTVPRAAAALRRSLRPVRRGDDQPETGHAAELVMTWVQPRTERSDEPGEFGIVENSAYPSARETDVGIPEPQSPVYRTRRVGWTPRAGLALISAIAAIVGVILVLHHQSGPSQAQRTAATAEASGTAEAVPSRTAFSDPRAYGAAMTRLALTSGRTEVDGKPACKADSTWDHWTCRARGKPTLGAYAGHWLMYRCSPNSTPQPGGQAAVMIGCRPVNPPPLTT
jgi:hypothetical protein